MRTAKKEISVWLSEVLSTADFDEIFTLTEKHTVEFKIIFNLHLIVLSTETFNNNVKFQTQIITEKLFKYNIHNFQIQIIYKIF